ncbi:MAG: VTT domain-containing protein [Pseudomonadota bacterium]
MNDIIILFIISFLSSTLLPGGSEAHLSWLVLNTNYSLLFLLVIASLGNTLGGFTNWLIGFFINHSVLTKLKINLPKKNKRYHIAHLWIKNWGVYVLLLSWLPLIGDLLCLIAGIYKLNWFKSLIVILIGKSIRYAILIYFLNGIKL